MSEEQTNIEQPVEEQPYVEQPVEEQPYVETANVSALMDSVYAINQTLLEKQQILKANVGHIELQLGKEVYQEALTQEQTDTLLDAVVRAKAAYVVVTPEE